MGTWLNMLKGPGARCPIGVDFGAHTLRAVQLRPLGPPGAQRRFALHAKAAVTLPTDTPASGAGRVEALARALHELLGSASFAGRSIVASLPASAISYKNLRLPQMPPDELAAAVEWEALDRLRSGEAGKGEAVVGGMHLQFFDAGEVRQGEDSRQEIILLAAPSAKVHEVLDATVRAGGTPTAIECVPSALARCLSHGEELKPDAEAQVLLDVGYSSTKVLVVRSGRVVFFKLIDLGGRQFNDAVAKKLRLSPADAAETRRQPMSGDQGAAVGVQRAVFDAVRPLMADLAREVSLCLRYYSVTFRGRRPERAFVVGGEAGDPCLVKVLQEESGVAVVGEQESQGAMPGQGVAGLNGQWMVAAGLSMRPPCPSTGCRLIVAEAAESKRDAA